MPTLRARDLTVTSAGGNRDAMLGEAMRQIYEMQSSVLPNPPAPNTPPIFTGVSAAESDGHVIVGVSPQLWHPTGCMIRRTVAYVRTGSGVNVDARWNGVAYASFTGVDSNPQVIDFNKWFDPINDLWDIEVTAVGCSPAFDLTVLAFNDR